jgi:hypothetical protein
MIARVILDPAAPNNFNVNGQPSFCLPVFVECIARVSSGNGNKKIPRIQLNILARPAPIHLTI